MFNSKEKKAIKERIKSLNKEFDQVIAAYEISMESGEATLDFYIKRWKERSKVIEEVGA